MIGSVTTVDPASRRHRKGATATSRFGVSRRESHDASAFYERFGRPELSDATDLAAHAERDRIWCGDARTMDAVGRWLSRRPARWEGRRCWR